MAIFFQPPGQSIQPMGDPRAPLQHGSISGRQGPQRKEAGRPLAMAPRRRVGCAAIVSAPAVPHPVRQLALLALAELLAMTLWFSATAVLPALRLARELSPTWAA